MARPNPKSDAAYIREMRKQLERAEKTMRRSDRVIQKGGDGGQGERKSGS